MTMVAAAGTLGAVLVAVMSIPLQSLREESATDLWTLARSRKNVHRFSTLFTAQDVRDRLSSPAGIDAAIQWCRQTGVTKAYVESFRDGYQARDEVLANARDRLRAAGMDVSGCVTPTRVGRQSTGWNLISCYTDSTTQQRVAEIFTQAARLFDEVMIDDFWFTDCACPECDAAREARTVRIGDRTYPVQGDTWEDYRCELMVRLSRDRVLAAARAANPRAKLIIKYPQWYDRFHERGYDVVRETADFDRIWVGTETRDYDDRQWGGTPQYEAYFIMRWLGGIGGRKCGGGWYDPYGTTEHTYVEQARQTVLGGARESLLFCYGSLLRGTGPANVRALRSEIPELLEVAAQVRNRPLRGIAAYKPPSSHPEEEPRVFDFVGMLGFPLVPCHEFPDKAPAAFFSVHALKDPDLAVKLGRFIQSGRPVLITDGLARRLQGRVSLDGPGVQVLAVGGDPKRLLELGAEELNALRRPLLAAVGARLEGPNRIALCLFRDGSFVVQNFNDSAATVRLNGESLALPARSWMPRFQARGAGRGD